MKNKKTYVWAITLVIVGLMITSTAISLTSENESEINSVGIPIGHRFVAAAEPIAREKVERTQLPARIGPGTDFPVFSLETDSQNPAVAGDGIAAVLVLDENLADVDMTHIWGRWSTDDGATWVDESSIVGWPFDVAVEKPKLDYYGKGPRAWGTITPSPTLTGDVHYIDFPDMTDPTAPSPQSPDGWSAWHVDWEGSGFSYMDSIDVSCYSDETNIPNPEFFGVVALSGDADTSSATEDHTMMFSFFVEGGQVTIIYFYNMAEDVRKMTTDIDQVTGKFYMVMEYWNHESHDDGTVINHNSITTDPDWWRTGWGGRYFEGLLNPAVVADDRNVYVVGEVVSDNQTDIVCYRSSNNGLSFTDTVVVDSVDNETFPSVTLHGDRVICSYFKNQDLYGINSTDGGATWNTPFQINDESGTVVEQYSGATVDGRFAAWTDERNDPDPTEIYFDFTDDPIPVPILKIISVTGGLGVTAVIENNGTGAATNVVSSLTVKGGILGLIDREVNDTTASLAVGGTIELKTGIMLGLGAIDISVNTVCDEGSTDSWTGDGIQLIIFTKVNE